MCVGTCVGLNHWHSTCLLVLGPTDKVVDGDLAIRAKNVNGRVYCRLEAWLHMRAQQRHELEPVDGICEPAQP